MLRLEKYIKEKHFSDWQDFVRINGHLFHDIRWLDIIQSSYHFKPFYNLIFKSDELIGLAPFFKITNKKLHSLPFISFSGFCFSNDLMDSEKDELIETLLLESEFADFNLELRTKGDKISEIKDAENQPKQYVTMIKELENDIDSAFKNFDKKQRNMIRKAEQEPFELLDCNLDTFYKIYLKATNDLGTPGHKKVFFYEIINSFAGSVRMKLLLRNKIQVGVLFEIDYFGTRYDLWAFSLKEFFQFKPNVFLYWETLKDAIEKGMEFYDFGRSTTGGGTYYFKRNWGAQPYGLEYYVIKRTDSGITKELLPPREGGKLPKIWAKIPHFITNFAGPFLRKYIV